MAYDATDFIAPTITKPIDYKAITDPRERLVALSGFLRGLPARRFSMVNSGTYTEAGTGECGSPACIGGWGRALFATPENYHSGSIRPIGTDLFGLSADQVQDLFFPVDLMGNGRGAMGATPTQAANVIDHYLAHGVIDWGKA